MTYTRQQMLRDLMVPLGIAAAGAAGWALISAIEAELTGQPFWRCVLQVACGAAS